MLDNHSPFDVVHMHVARNCRPPLQASNHIHLSAVICHASKMSYRWVMPVGDRTQKLCVLGTTRLTLNWGKTYERPPCTVGSALFPLPQSSPRIPASPVTRLYHTVE